MKSLLYEIELAMARVRCVTMQKDEGLLLDAWLRYYGYLFGFDNLEVLDNGSGDSLTCSILKQFEAVGVTVHRQFTSTAEFEAKGSIVAGIIEGWDRTHSYDFALPCDIDEFIALFTTDGLSCRRDRIEDTLDSLLGCEQALWMETSLFNVPSQPGWFHAEIFPKGFLPSRSILSLDSGYHIPQSRLCEGTRRTDLTYLHYHNKPYALVQAHTRRKLATRVDLNNLSALRAYVGAGAHMTKDLLMSREEYVHQFDRALTLHLEPFPTLMRALGAREAMIVGDAGSHADAPSDIITLRLPAPAGGPAELVAFDGRGYLDDHLDVASDNGRSLPHYLYYGFQEGRRLRRSDQAREPIRMNSQTPAHDFLLPRLAALVDEAVAQGILRDVAVAVLTDLVTAPEFNTASPDPMADSEPHPDREPAPQDAVLMASEKNALVEQVVQPRGFI